MHKQGKMVAMVIIMQEMQVELMAMVVLRSSMLHLVLGG
jgi:hypothetical protein